MAFRKWKEDNKIFDKKIGKISDSNYRAYVAAEQRRIMQ